MKIEKLKLEYTSGAVGALMIWQDGLIPTTVAVFTHGYTSHKGSLLNWAMRLSELGVASIIFDQPGHYLGTFSEVESFDSFKTEVPNLFQKAFSRLSARLELKESKLKLILGGHSLGALMALKACELPALNNCSEQILICVGFGLPPEGVTHVFDAPFYKATLDARGQLVSPHICPDVIFPWIKEQKKSLKVSGKNIFLLSGEDDVVVGDNGTEELAKILEQNNNKVTIEKPGRLAHHLPENAAPHIKKIVKELVVRDST